MSLRWFKSDAAHEASAGALVTFLALILRGAGLGEGWRESGEEIFQGHTSNRDEICPVTAIKAYKYKYFDCRFVRDSSPYLSVVFQLTQAP